MSNTRHSQNPEEFNQEKYLSSTALVRGLSANVVAVRCQSLKKASDIELVWALQYFSHQDGGLEKLTQNLWDVFPARQGTQAMRSLPETTHYQAEQVKAVRDHIIFGLDEFPLHGELPQNPCDILLPNLLREFCVDPAKTETYLQVSYFDHLYAALQDYLASQDEECVELLFDYAETSLKGLRGIESALKVARHHVGKDRALALADIQYAIGKSLLPSDKALKEAVSQSIATAKKGRGKALVHPMPKPLSMPKGLNVWTDSVKSGTQQKRPASPDNDTSKIRKLISEGIPPTDKPPVYASVMRSCFMHSPKPDPYAVLRYPNYCYFVLGRSFFTLAMQMQTVAVSWDIYQRLNTNPSNAALALGLIGLVQVLPMLLLALPGGQAADRFDRKTIVRTSQLLFALCALILLILSRLHVALGWYYFVLGLAACGRAFSVPAISSLFPTLVPRGLLPNAMTWNSTIFQITAMLGPALGGLILATWGVATSYIINILGAGLAFLTFSLTVPVTTKTDTSPITLDSLFSGVRFVFGTRLLLGLFCLDLFAVLLGGATALLPIFANDLLKVGPQGYGLLRAAPSVGAIFMAMLTAHLPPWRKAGSVMLLGVAGYGIATLLFGFSKLFWLSIIALALTGMFDNISVVVRQTVMQMITPDAMRGRVSAITFLFISCSNELGELESGLTARWMGAVGSVIFGGIGTLLVVLGSTAIFPEIGKLGRLHELEPAKLSEITEQELEEKDGA